MLTKMLCVTEHKRISWEELFVLFDLIKKKTQQVDKVTFHRSVIEEMLSI